MDAQVKVWGSGLIKPSEERWKHRFSKKLKEAEFLAVRGRLTQAELISKVGASVPDVYGDPALLLPRYFNPQSTAKIKIALCPHQAHYAALQKKFAQYEDVVVIDVKKDPREVISLIANADVCISSSLHGLIIAQAYHVPWMWLRFEDQQLVGDKFKFFDFYSTLQACPDDHIMNILFSQFEYSTLVNAIAQARLFELSIDLDALDDSLSF